MNDIITEEMLNKWWNSFQQQLLELGLDPKNPSVLATIMVNNNRPCPADSEGNAYDFGYIDPQKYPASLNKHLEKRKELMDPYSYGFMETENGKYLVPRPEKGETINWMHDNLKDFNTAPRHLKEHLYRMAKDNRLLLRDTDNPNTYINQFRFIKVDPEGNASVTCNFNDLHNGDVTPASQGFTPEEYEKAKREMLASKGLENTLTYSIMSLLSFTNDINYGEFQQPENVATDIKNRIRMVLQQDSMLFENFFTSLHVKHPDRYQTQETRKQIDRAIRCNQLSKTLRLHSEDLFTSGFREISSNAEKDEKKILEITGCSDIEEAMNSGKVMHLNGAPFSREDTLTFTREYMKAIESSENGLLLVGEDGKKNVYSPRVDGRLAPGIRWQGFSKAFMKISDELTTKSAEDSPEHAFDEAFYSIKDMVEASKDIHAMDIEGVEPEFNSLAEEATTYLRSLNMPDSKLSPVQMERKKAATLCIHFRDCFKTRDERIYENMSEKFPDVFSKPNPHAAEKPAHETSPTPLDIKAYQSEFNRLYKDLLNTDSKLSNDSREYKDLKSNLHSLLNHGFNGMILDKCFPEEMEDLVKHVNAACESYMENHRSLNKLSDRQQRRLKVMHRIMDLTDSIRKGVPKPQEDRIEKLAGKLVQNQLIQAYRKGQATTAEQGNMPKELLTDHKKLKTAMNALKKDPAFMALCKNKDNLQKLLETNGEKLTREFSVLRKELSLKVQKGKPVQVKASSPRQII